MQASLETFRIRKEFPGTVALEDVSLRFEGGRVVALLGKNGAGKSTLVKILAGTLQPTSGQIAINGRPVKLKSAGDAFRHGIATVYQELSVIPELSAAENILLGRMPGKRGWARVMLDWPAARRRAREILAEMGVDLDVHQKVRRFGVAQQQIIEIAKAMSFNPSVLMLDEPTSALARHETEMLFRVVRRLARSGVAVIYITHRLHELAQIADAVTVLRDGHHVGTANFAETSADSIVRMIFGSVVQRQRPQALQPSPEPLLQVRGLCRAEKFHDIDFTVHRGEILGIAGMLGSGRTELLRAIFGADPFDGGRIILGGRILKGTSVRGMKRLGAALIPENRKEQSLVPNLSVRANLCLASLDAIGWNGLISVRRENLVARHFVQRLDIQLANLRLPVHSLSGGNQQKVAVGKWLNTQPRVMLFDEPTRGIDLQAKQQIFQIMWDLSRDGIGSVFVSSELEELLEVCHRILIMRSGAIIGEVRPEDISVEDLVVRCMGESAGARSEP
ncbi:MAG: sugar ABC transporter ATP-binding protein [Tepidisphaeraceae bacterium]